ncbi:MAG: COQ9 family protein [Rickettsia endosymbiont of Bryobia graminum]|nr:COQ9 family protein [Rickettsia endosymbiont of Bryobia graminum]
MTLECMLNYEEKYHNLKLQFIEAISDLLVFDEWDNKLLEEAETRCGFAKGYSSIIFPNGLSEIIDFLEDQYDQKMLNLLANQILPDKIRDRIDLALRIRIKDCTHKLVLLRNSCYFTNPINNLHAMKIAWRTCDLIWRYAGDKSMDYNYYTKRSLLFSAYTTSIIYYIQDNSDNNIETDKYITDSLSGIIAIFSKCKNIFKLPQLVDIPIIRLFS